jgi:catechol 2,3-dioxygenase-like lactoylglutathione lyase family enzyme
MTETLHHVHLFASNLDESLRFYREMFGAEVIFDMEMAGARNALIAIGKGKVNFYDQPPRDNSRGVMHHLGIETDDL